MIPLKASPETVRLSVAGTSQCSIGDEELPMTMQVGMVGVDGIILASDTKIYSEPAGYGRTITSGVLKIVVSKDAKVAVSCARDMPAAYRVAEAVISDLSLRDSHRPESRIYEIALTELAKGKFDANECLILLSDPHRLYLYSSGMPENGSWPRAYCSPVPTYAFCGHATNAAVFWADRFYSPSIPRLRTTDELVPLAAQIIFDAGKISSGSIGGLEMVRCDADGINIVDTGIQLEAEAYRRSARFEELLFGVTQ